ncbi:hypothetical protein GLOTRDRAFT_126767 [Gloeophyllum trabeum ATCC 11539]|uniref:Mitotic checkpoint regulator, MAD2B-interacting-domain-containing protein n=1 Tax=Gloeophyllum trabeum (strain ATCC 11539 / FP-39264 / Madison 617) TaxID=670483 RepID=S7RU77_GLOTA|nr:uncharacterized protein GLOTRDRAFT_126767 [Gloeophyllum trabeum ATCC 11539]EPQ58275.1 hypothetical protein GLOTRDRAFT_126767 [Gloeophyllum trabeum ATCC 11539]
MLGVEGYGSDNETDQELDGPFSASVASSIAKAHLQQPQKTSGLNLPPPANAKASGSKGTGSGLSLPLPKAKSTQKKKKITIDLPTLDDDDEDNEDKPLAKKPRLESGAGSSKLLSMLPAPKQKVPLPPPKERVLGGGHGPGLVFNTSSHSATDSTDQTADDNDEDAGTESSAAAPSAPSISFLPVSLQKGKPNISTEGPPRTAPKVLSTPRVSAAPAVDFFSLGSSSSSRRDTVSPVPAGPLGSSQPSPLPKIPTGISSAPKVDDFVPPEPTPTDPYPGYYLTPTGQWAAYDPDYYKKFYDKWKREYDAHVRALEKGQVKGFEGLNEEEAQEVNAIAEMERAKKEIQEREEKKRLTQGGDEAPAAPKMNIKGAALGGRARSRHQLSTLLTEAYSNRKALEEKIAQGRRNRKEAGMKYGGYLRVPLSFIQIFLMVFSSRPIYCNPD